MTPIGEGVGAATYVAGNALKTLGEITIRGEIKAEHNGVLRLIERTPQGAVGAQIVLKPSTRLRREFDADQAALRLTVQTTTVWVVVGRWTWLQRWTTPVLLPVSITRADTTPTPGPVVQQPVLVSVQRNLPVPTRIGSVAVVCPAGSAAKADIQTQLPAGLRVLWHHPTFDQPTQIAAVVQMIGRVDVIVIARGGGSDTDLDVFNHTALVETVAAHSVPIWTGIGHATNVSKTDNAAQRSFPTPTAVAATIAQGLAP